jgi:nitrite reductase/ring-hydroxylating ferredoxin subunit/uncharacterized membrane protein
MSFRLADRAAKAAAPLDPLSETVQTVIRDRLAAAPAPLRDALDGTWLGAPLHPALTDVPIGAWAAAFALDTVEGLTGLPAVRAAADGALTVGALAALPAAATGASDWRYLRGDSRRLGSAHALLNVTGLGLNLVSLALRGAGQRGAGRAVSAAGLLATAAAAHLGGQLSFGLGVRVNRTAWPTADEEQFQAVLDDEELPSNDLRRVKLGEVPVLVSRREDGSVCAIAATCSHLGGPLDEGERDGDIVTCPWHGSRFDLCRGEVVEGPAVFPQPRYEERLYEGKIELRAAQ